MTLELFERHIAEALAAIPERFREELKGVAFVVEETADRNATDDVFDGECLGLYEGVPRSEYTGDPTGLLPDKITIFRNVIEEEAETTGEDPARIIRHTVWHEVAHFFGFNEEDARRLETKWEERRNT
ncbi:MAG: metallopeptidase family protein [Patescibacteria group bacterium]